LARGPRIRDPEGAEAPAVRDDRLAVDAQAARGRRRDVGETVRRMEQPGALIRSRSPYLLRDHAVLVRHVSPARDLDQEDAGLGVVTLRRDERPGRALELRASRDSARQLLLELRVLLTQV